MSTSKTLREFFQSPLMRSEALGLRPEGFLRQVLAEAAYYGMPPQLVATLDDVAAIMGFHQPLTMGQASQVAGPLSAWRTSRYQPTFDAVTDVESLAYKQRALIAFGAVSEHMVGTAEIVYAMGNVEQELMERLGGVEPEYREVFYWASVDVLSILTGRSKAAVWRIREWKPIEDDDVLKPEGRLFKVYTEMATYIRRTAIDAMKDDHPRHVLRPVAETFMESHHKVLKQIEEKFPGDPEMIEVADKLKRMIKMTLDMYPDLKDPSEPNPPAGAR